jgi:hypothetical protein
MGEEEISRRGDRRAALSGGAVIFQSPFRGSLPHIHVAEPLLRRRPSTSTATCSTVIWPRRGAAAAAQQHLRVIALVRSQRVGAATARAAPGPHDGRARIIGCRAWLSVFATEIPATSGTPAGAERALSFALQRGLPLGVAYGI